MHIVYIHNIRTYIQAYIIHTYIIFTYTHIHTHMLDVCMHACMPAYTYTCDIHTNVVHTYAYIHIQTCIHRYTHCMYVHLCMYVYACTHVHMYSMYM